MVYQNAQKHTGWIILYLSLSWDTGMMAVIQALNQPSILDPKL